MKTKKELEQDILNITLKIQKDFPELYKYIDEMPENLSNNKSDHIELKYFRQYYNSLEQILEEYSKTHQSKSVQSIVKSFNFPGYPSYPPSEDIYSMGKVERNLDPEDISKHKSPIEKPSALNEKDFEEDMTGEDLDIPGSEMDDQQESVGSEDEENNYYSLGGDNHDDLEEDTG